MEWQTTFSRADDLDVMLGVNLSSFQRKSTWSFDWKTKEMWALERMQ